MRVRFPPLVRTENQKGDPADYKIGVKNVNGRYCAIILESDNSIWRTGDVKAVLEKTENTNLYSITYYLSDKTKKDAFGELDDLILTISLKDVEHSSGSAIKFLKISPK